MSITRRKYNRYRERIEYKKPLFNKIKSDDKFYKELFEYWQVDINKPSKQEEKTCTPQQTLKQKKN